MAVSLHSMRKRRFWDAVRPDVQPNPSPDRQADLAAAKALVAQIQEEGQQREDEGER
jgi:hypothetical protein